MSEIGYIQFDGVSGSATEQNHKDWSKIYAISGGVHRPAGDASTGVRNDRATVEEIMVLKEYDKASPPLFQKGCEGKIVGKVKIHLTNSTGNHETWLSYELEDVRITGYNNSSSLDGNGSIINRDNLRLSFGKVKVEHTSFDGKGNAGGKAQGSWNVVEAKP